MMPELVFDACEYSHIPQHTKVITVPQIGYYLWIKLPEGVATRYRIVQVSEVNGCALKDSDIYFEKGRPWIKVLFAAMNSNIGLHRYQIQFIDKTTDELASLFISYIMQNDNPYKPYVYMKERSKH